MYLYFIMVKKGGSIKRRKTQRKAFRGRTKKASSNLTPKHVSLNLSPRKRSTPKKASSVTYASLKFSSSNISRKNTKRKAMKRNPRVKVT